jgi:citrate synthase
MLAGAAAPCGPDAGHLAGTRDERSDEALSAVALFASAVAGAVRRRRLVGGNWPETNADGGFLRWFLRAAFGYSTPTLEAALQEVLALVGEPRLPPGGWPDVDAIEQAYRQLQAFGDSGQAAREFYGELLKSGVPAFGFGSEHRPALDPDDPRVELARLGAERAFHRLGGVLYPLAERAVRHMRTLGKTPDRGFYVACTLESLGFWASEAPALVVMGRVLGTCANSIDDVCALRLH